ncbi:MAG TPA: serine/threonine-protein kinase [Myxococcales bacterium]|nr:serine/threonine-protein kinase [Myxococcales bacterium]
MTTPIGKYKLVRLIAAGGMAEVYLARQAGAAGFQKLVCLKRILPHLARDKQFVEMFLNEARLAARLDHPNIVSIFDLGGANGNYFIAMEFIDGPSLRAVGKRAHERGERLPIAEVVKIISMAASGLHYAHELAGDDGKPLGLVHRDISPDNILVHRNGAAKVVDFGIAKAANSGGMTRTGTLKGKVAYMPPEQLRGDPLDRRADVFALGVVLYEMIAGQRPWEGDSEVSLIGRIISEEPRPLASARPDAPAGLVAVIDRALAKDREARYASCHDLQADLEALLVMLGQNISAARISDFAKAYAEPAAAPDESTGAAMQALEAEMNGTGPVAPVPRRPAARQVLAPTVAIAPPPARDRRGFAYGLVAFLCVAGVGGGAGYVYLQRRGDFRPEPVAIERAAAVEQPAAKPPAPEKKDDPAPPQEAPKVADAQPAAPSTPAPAPGASAVVPVTAAAVAAAPPPVTPAAAPVAATPAAATTPVVATPAAPVAATPAPAPQPVATPSAPPPETPPAPAPKVRTRRPIVVQVPESTPVAAAKGELILLIRPWAKVEVDGRDVGVTPLNEPLMLAAGDHVVRLVNPDLGKDITRTVRITASGREVLKEILDE